MKVYQAVWALLQSLSKSKTALLREYLDGVYWGRSLRGLDQAARIYFNVSRAELSPAQSFFLAERIATPNRFRANRLRALLDRHAIQEAFHRYKITRDEIVNLYRQCDGLGDDVWQLLAK
jgi:membrane peptidoglycan carboxypeptidase